MNPQEMTDKALAELRWLFPAISADLTRHTISKVIVDERGTAVATDGHRMHLVEGSCLPVGFTIGQEELEAIFTLAKLYPKRSISFDGKEKTSRWSFFSVSGGTCTLESRFNTADFPEFRRVVPPERELVEARSSELRKTNGKPIAIGPGHFNARYVDEALRGAPKRVRVQTGRDDHEPLLIRYDNRLAVVMPMRAPLAEKQTESTT